ncbi:MAG: hypothetical protein LBP80_10875 [Treponema sp.]|nr:hypothetical protein [Treponema sp.]
MPEKDVQVYYLDGSTAFTGSGTVNLASWDDSAKDYVVIAQAGTVTDGKLTLNMPKTLDDKYLYSLGEMMPDGVTVSPADVKSRQEVNIYIYYEESRINGLYYGDLSGTAGYRVQYMYFSKAATIKGSYEYPYETDRDGNAVTTVRNNLDISVKAGWNLVYTSMTMPNKTNTTGTATTTTDLSKMPSTLKWLISTEPPKDGNNSGSGEGSDNSETEEETLKPDRNMER